MVALKNIENPVVFEDLLIKKIFFLIHQSEKFMFVMCLKTNVEGTVKILQTAFSIGRSRVHLDMAIHQVLSDVRGGVDYYNPLILITFIIYIA